MTSKKQTYTDAFNELQSILEKIENDELDVDQLSKNVKKAADLIKFCKNRLYNTENEIEKILKGLEEDE